MPQAQENREWTHYYQEESEKIYTRQGQEYELETSLRKKKFFKKTSTVEGNVDRGNMVPVHVGQYDPVIIMEDWGC